jgi:hypothetical protein
MRNEDLSLMVRRSFLRIGALGSLLGVLGCDGGGETTVEKPAVDGGNKSKLDRLKGKVEALPAPKKRK